LTLAKWFFSPEQPLTARTAVNRYWEQLFGTGIVETLENFGSVGEEPSHPELLDWLSLHFQNDLHWDMKALLRELVSSATYRQSARATPALTERDPRNRLLARGPQQRLTAEMVRDQALMASGLLTATMGGPPVMPPQPEGVWNSVYNDSKWVDATGPDRYRRAIYTYIKRTSGYPSFLTFDASDHDVSLARRIPTNTPLQALVTLNDPVYEEASEALLRGTSRTVTIGERQVFVEAFPKKPRLVIVGAVEVARSLAVYARELGFEVVVVDGRASFATPERFPPERVDRLIVGWPDEVAEEIGLGADDAVAVLTHDVKFDEPAIVEALRRGCRYVGAVGSKKTQGDRRERLLEAGVTPDELARLRGPVGLDLGGRNPAETALAIIAEVVAERYGGSGVPLHDRARAAAARVGAVEAPVAIG
jgi:xanthine/CO dehydrogenase XdhC/CoxF family maturation factor